MNVFVNTSGGFRMNRKNFARLGVAVTLGGTAAVSALGVACVHGWKWLQETARETIVEPVDCKPATIKRATTTSITRLISPQREFPSSVRCF